MFERRLYYHLDWAMLGAVLTLCAVGVGMIYSATYDPQTGAVGPQFRTQLYAITLGLVALLMCLTIDYRLLANSSLLMYGGLLALLVYVMAVGAMGGGA